MSRAAGRGHLGGVSPFEPIPETRRALDGLAPAPEGLDGDWLDALLVLAERARVLVPDLVGVSVEWLEAGLTFTVVASHDEIAVLDAVQYLAGASCADGARSLEVERQHEDDVLDEERWRLFAQASAAHTIRSTLTLPVLGEGGSVCARVDLYAASGRAFGDVREELADLFGAWAAGAISNADLPFATLQDARRAPGQVHDAISVETAVGILVTEQGVDEESARRSLEVAAIQAGTSVVLLAREIVAAHRAVDGQGDGEGGDQGEGRSGGGG